MPEPATQTPATPRAKRTPRPKWVGWVVLLVLIVVGYLTYEHFKPQPKSAMITDTVKRGDLVETITASGSVAAQTGQKFTSARKSRVWSKSSMRTLAKT